MITRPLPFMGKPLLLLVTAVFHRVVGAPARHERGGLWWRSHQLGHPCLRRSNPNRATVCRWRRVRPPRSPTPPPRALLDESCVGCHSARVRTAGLVLENPGERRQRAHAWEKVVGKLRVGAMPPPSAPTEMPRSSGHGVARNGAGRAASRAPNPGRTEAIHRLNRAEYQNAIRDVLGLDIDVSPLLPADDADGFDNMASLLSVSPALLERYLSAARKVSRLAVGTPPPGPVTDSYTVPDLAMQDGYASEDLPFGSRGGIAIRHYFPVDGEYLFKVRLKRQIYDYILGLDRAKRWRFASTGCASAPSPSAARITGGRRPRAWRRRARLPGMGALRAHCGRGARSPAPGQGGSADRGRVVRRDVHRARGRAAAARTIRRVLARRDARPGGRERGHQRPVPLTAPATRRAAAGSSSCRPERAPAKRPARGRF